MKALHAKENVRERRSIEGDCRDCLASEPRCSKSTMTKPFDLKACVGLFVAGALVWNILSFHLNMFHCGRDLHSSEDRSHFSGPISVIWTYPAPFTSNINNGHELPNFCIYHTCLADGYAKRIHVSTEKMPLIFKQFWMQHHIYKVRYGMDFVHHVQAVVLLSYVIETQTCAKTAGNKAIICPENVIKYMYDVNSLAVHKYIILRNLMFGYG